jgi:hypothetical protein
MRPAARVAAICASAGVLILVCGFGPESPQAANRRIGADVIVTAAPAYDPLAALKGNERFPKGAQLLLLHGGSAESLVARFAATADADVSFDAKTVVFAGKQNAGDPWQIWELTVATHAVRRAVTTATDAVRPLYLPAGRIVYAEREASGFQLVSVRIADDPNFPLIDPVPSPLRLTYVPGNAIPADVLHDGRILFEAGYPLGTGSTPEMYLVYSDGSGVESYRCDHGNSRWGGKQLASGDVVFTHGATLARFASPLATEAHVVAPRGDYAGGIAETSAGDWLVSARSCGGAGASCAATARFALKLWKRGGTQPAAAMDTLLARSGTDIVQPVLVAARTRPNRHPSGLHPWNYANMLTLDARQSREGDLKTTPAMVRLETQDPQGHAVVTGTAPVEKDGSFFVKTPADRPVRFALLNEKGAVVRQEHGWFWIRSGEQRICVGCHTGPERASENRVPAVLLRTTEPADLSGLTAKPDEAHAKAGGN